VTPQKYTEADDVSSPLTPAAVPAQPAPPPASSPQSWLAHPAFLAHMNMLQSVITRLAGNSASCKTWCSGLVTTVLSLAGSARLPQLLPLALVPILVFAFLDTNYLCEERRFRKRFEELAAEARGGAYGCADLFGFGRPAEWKRPRALLSAFFSWSILSYYGGLIVLYLAAWWLGLLDLLARPAGK
jgi:hypothetical protein